MSYSKSEIPSSARTAITRHSPSALARFVGEQLLPLDMVFDWGCGKGFDIVHYLKNADMVCGWDPHFNPAPHPNTLKSVFNIVTCSCVLNVLQKQERETCLHDISDFLPCGGKAYFSVRTKHDIDSNKKPSWKQENDGWITSIGTFQHGFRTDELKKLISQYFKTVNVMKRTPLIIEALK